MHLKTPIRIPFCGGLPIHPPNPKADILHDQARYYGQRGIHYHQFLQAGENTLNVKLAKECLLMLYREKIYSSRVWLEQLVKFMTTPGTHKDTYVEEYLRYFFTSYGKGKDVMNCGRKDENHIGGLSLFLPVLIVFAKNRDNARKKALQHLFLTHGGHAMARGGGLIADILLDLLYGMPLNEAIASKDIYNQKLESLMGFTDHSVVTECGFGAHKAICQIFFKHCFCLYKGGSDPYNK